jgi:hypothetical protein
MSQETAAGPLQIEIVVEAERPKERRRLRRKKA